MTEKLNIEQTDFVKAQAAEAENDSGASGEEVSYGKFKNAESLLNAYNSLQAEFTRRCQRLKELEEITKAANKADVEEAEKTAVKAAAETATGAAEKAANEEGKEAGFDESIRKTVPETSEKAANGAEQPDLLKTDSEQATGDDENKEKGEENAPARVISAKEREDVLKEYLESVLQKKTGAILMEGAGASLKTPRSRPKTVEEAGRLFRDSFGNV